MSDPLARGRRLVLAVIVGVLAVDATFIIWETTARGHGNLAANAVRFLLTALFLWFLYRGVTWTRWLLGIATAIAAPIALAGGLISRFANIAGIWLFAAGIVYALTAYVLLFDPAVREFTSRKRNRSAAE